VGVIRAPAFVFVYPLGMANAAGALGRTLLSTVHGIAALRRALPGPARRCQLFGSVRPNR
jgi:hypothetical protein